MQRDYDAAVGDARKAVELAPGSADAAELASFVLAPPGYPDEAVVQSEKAIALSPNDPAVYLGTLGNAYRLSRQTEQAIAAFKAYHARSPGFGLTDIVIAYQETGQTQEAMRAAEQLPILRSLYGSRPSSSAAIRRGSRPIPMLFALLDFRQARTLFLVARWMSQFGTLRS
jgi:tetratricopeptide (TPR) repeat protein